MYVDVITVYDRRDPAQRDRRYGLRGSRLLLHDERMGSFHARMNFMSLIKWGTWYRDSRDRLSTGSG